MFETHYTNEYGDDWVFRYDPETATGTVEGSDVGWEKYPVLRGFAALSLELSSAEGMWLWRSWRRAVDRYGDPGIYGKGALDLPQNSGGVPDDIWLRLEVDRLPGGKRVGARKEKLTSGREINWHGDPLEPHEPIRVTVSRP